MQPVSPTKADYKNSMIRKSRMTQQHRLKLKWIFAIGLLIFAIVWRLFPSKPTPTIEAQASFVQEVGIPQKHHSKNPHPDVHGLALPPPPHTLSGITNDLEDIPNDTPLINPDLISAVMKPHAKQFVVQPGDNLATLFQQAKLTASELHRLLESVQHSRLLHKLKPEQEITFELDEAQNLQQLHLKIDNIKSLLVKRVDANQFESRCIEKPVELKLAYGSGKIEDSLYLAGKQAQLSDRLIMMLADIFGYDIDFALDIRPGDTFKVLFEEKYVEGEKVENGAILAAEFVSRGKKYQAFRYQTENNQPGYFKADGQSIKKAFIRTPVEYTRISSHFNLKRKHPVLHKIRAHKGVDYAAPTGTPVKASGNGQIIFFGSKGGYGNTVILQHGPKYSTLYGHLSGFAKGLSTGKRVKQGQVIGYVGSTGLASGPHLHYEFRINGEHHNPLTVALPNAKGIPEKKLKDYQEQIQSYLAFIDTHEKVMVAISEQRSETQNTQLQ